MKSLFSDMVKSEDKVSDEKEDPKGSFYIEGRLLFPEFDTYNFQ